MTDRCKWVSSDQPRVLPQRHLDGCEDETCRGCQPCAGPHCVVCGIEHSLGACGGCVGEVRETLEAITSMCDNLLAEAIAHGVNGEAMNLLGPAANPEARGHWEASVLAGRITPVDCDAHEVDDVKTWLDHASHELHPLIVVGGWAVIYRDAFDHDEPTGRVDLPAEIGYLERNLTYAANFEHVPFSDFARDLRRCQGHLMAVLHDQERGERANVDCFDCGGDLERRLGDKGFDDRWTCSLCRRKYTIAEYNFALRAKLEESATETLEEIA